MCQNSWCRLQFLKTRISNAFSSTGTSIETMILLITLYIIDILGSGYFPKRKGYLSKSHAMIMYSKTSQRLDMEHCCGVLLKQLTHVNQSLMLETDTFPHLIASNVVSVKKCAQGNSRNCFVWGILRQKFKKSDFCVGSINSTCVYKNK